MIMNSDIHELSISVPVMHWLTTSWFDIVEEIAPRKTGPQVQPECAKTRRVRTSDNGRFSNMGGALDGLNNGMGRLDSEGDARGCASRMLMATFSVANRGIRNGG